MGIHFPQIPPQDGDDPSTSPRSNDRSLLGTDSGGNTRRLLVDNDRSLYVHITADDTSGGGSGSLTSASALAVGALTSVTHNSLSTVVTFASLAGHKVTKVVCSGTVYAKYQLFLNMALIATKRSGPDRSLDFSFETPLKLNAADILEVKVTHYNTGLLENFEASVFGG